MDGWGWGQLGNHQHLTEWPCRHQTHFTEREGDQEWVS